MKIFIIASNEDYAFVKKFQNALKRKLRADYWVDNHVNYDVSWTWTIQRQLDSSNIFILLMTTNSLNSKWIEYELNYVRKTKKRIISFLLEGNPDYWLQVDNYYDLRDGDFYSDNFFEKLSSMVVSMVNKPYHVEKSQSTVKWFNGSQNKYINLGGDDVDVFIGHSESERDFLQPNSDKSEPASSSVDAYNLAGDDTTDAPPPEDEDKNRRGK